MNHWLAIPIAIIAEVIATTALKASNEFTRLAPSLLRRWDMVWYFIL